MYGCNYLLNFVYLMLAANTTTVSVYEHVFCTMNNCVRTHNARVSDSAKEQLNFSLKWLTAKNCFSAQLPY